MSEQVIWTLEIDGSGAISTLDEISAALDGLIEKFAQVAASASDLSSVDESLAGMSAAATEAVTATEGLDEAMVATGEVTAGMSEAFASLSAQMSEDTATISALNETVANLEGQIAALTLEEENAGAATANFSENLAAAGPIFLQIASSAIQAGQQFLQTGIQAQAGMSLVKNMAGATDQDIQNLEGAAVNLGVGMKDAAAGMYEVSSAGFTGKDAMTVFSDATMAAKSSGAQASDMLNSLTSILHAYGAGAGQAGNYTDEMVKTIIQGKQSASDFASAIGPLAAAGHNVGMSFAEVTAAEATMTQINPHVAQDAQQLRFLFNATGLSIDAVAATAKKLHVAFNETKYKSMDLIERLEYLAKVAGGTNTEAFKKLVGGSAGMSAALAVMSSKGETFKQNLDAIAHSAGTTQTAFDASQQDMGAQLDKMSAAFSRFALDTVNALSKTFGPMLSHLADQFGQFSTFLSQHITQVLPVLAGLATMVGVTLVIAFGTLLAPMMAALIPLSGAIIGIGAAVTGLIYICTNWSSVVNQVNTFLHTHQVIVAAVGGVVAGVATILAITFVPAMIAAAASAVTGFAAWAAGAATAAIATLAAEAPIIAIGLLVAVVVAGIILAVQHWSQITDILKSAWATVLSFLTASLHAVQATFTGVVNGVSSAISSVIGWFNRWKGVIEGVAIVLGVVFGPALIRTGVQATVSGAQLVASFIASVVRSGASATVSGAQIAASFVASMIRTGAQAVITGAQIAASFVASMIRAGIQAVLTSASMIGSLIPAILSTAAAMISTAVPAIISVITGMISYAAAGWAAAAATIAATWPFLLLAAAIALVVVGIVLAIQHWGQIIAWLRGVWAGFTAWFMGAVQAVGNFFVSVWQHIVSFFQQAFTVLVNVAKIAAMALLVVVTGPFGLLVAFVISHWTQVQAFLNAVWNAIVVLATSTWDSIKNTVASTCDTILHAISSFIQGVIDWFTQMPGRALNAVQALGSMLGSFFGGLANQALQWGADLIQNIASGITNAIGSVTSAVTAVGNAISSVLHHTKPDTGPLVDDDQWGAHLINNLIEGMEGQRAKLQGTVQGIAQSMAFSLNPTISPTMNTVAPASAASLSTGQSATLLQQILATLQQMNAKAGGAGASSSTVHMNNTINAPGIGDAQQLYNLFQSLGGFDYQSIQRGSFGL